MPFPQMNFFLNTMLQTKGHTSVSVIQTNEPHQITKNMTNENGLQRTKNLLCWIALMSKSYLKFIIQIIAISLRNVFYVTWIRKQKEYQNNVNKNILLHILCILLRR